MIQLLDQSDTCLNKVLPYCPYAPRNTSLPATRQPKEQKDRVHAKIDLKGGVSVLVRWDKAAGKKRHKIETYEATVVEIDRAQGAKPVQVEFGTGETAWVTASCVPRVGGRQPREASQTRKS